MDTLNESEPAVAVADEKPFRFFRHATINRFVIGDFEFRDHLLTVPAEKMPDFLETIRKATKLDQNAISEILEIRNERPLSEVTTVRTIRGELGTDKIVDKVDNPPAKSATPNSLMNQLRNNAGQGAGNL